MAASHDFDDWLCSKLKSLQLDEEVFLDYIKGVLEEETSEEEKFDTIENILEGAIEDPSTSNHECETILKHWNDLSNKIIETTTVPVKIGNDNADEKIRDIIHKQQAIMAANKPTSTKDDEYKRRLLEQYSHVEENDDSQDEKQAHSKDSSQSETSLFQNMNVKTVIEQQKLHREKQKKAGEEKKEKDKMNREVDKLKKQERQEKEKKRTQKGERRAR